VPLREVEVERHDVSCSCGAAWTTPTAPGKRTTCKACGADVRVPLPKVDVERHDYTCEGCGAVQSTTTEPGRRTTCKACGAEVRVPLRDPARTLPGQAETLVGPCRVCGRHIDVRLPACPDCGAPRKAFSDDRAIDLARAVGALSGDERRSPFGILVGVSLMVLTGAKTYSLGWEVAAFLSICAGLVYHLGGRQVRRAIGRRRRRP
jgi:hypothetical protein